MQIYSIGIDLRKTTFYLVAPGAAGKVLVKSPAKLTRLYAAMARFLPLFPSYTPGVSIK